MNLADILTDKQQLTTSVMCQVFFDILEEMDSIHQDGKVIENFGLESIYFNGDKYTLDMNRELESYAYIAPEVLYEGQEVTIEGNYYSFSIILDTLQRGKTFWKEKSFRKIDYSEWMKDKEYGVDIITGELFTEVIMACSSLNLNNRVNLKDKLIEIAKKNQLLSDYFDTRILEDYVTDEVATCNESDEIKDDDAEGRDLVNGSYSVDDKDPAEPNYKELDQETYKEPNHEITKEKEQEIYEDAELEAIEGREIGIDLGTSNSTVAYMKNGKVNYLEIRNESIIPSAIFFDSKSKILFGRKALQKGIQYPESFVSHFKRSLGKKMDVVYADSIGMKKKDISSESNTYIFDTNTLVDDPFIIEGIKKEHRIIIPTVVVDEINHRTGDPDTEIQARKAEEIIERYKSRIEFVDSDLNLLPKDMFRNERSTNNNQNDNKILSVAVKFADKNTYLITSDKGLITKVHMMNEKGTELSTKTQKEFSYEKTMGSRNTTEDGSFKISGEEAATLYLKYLKDEVSSKIGYVTKAYITVPANFDSFKVKAIKDAAEQAGFAEVETQKEPISAAIAYGLNIESNKTIFVYDFGGGTFDITIIRISGEEYEVVDYDGDPKLGGEDFTQRLVEHFSEYLYDEYDMDMNSCEESGLAKKEYLHNKVNIREACERCKIDLSTYESSELEADVYIKTGERKVISLSISRKEFESLIKDLVNQARSKLNDILMKNSLQPEDIDVIVLAGGTSLIPCIKDSVKNYFGKMPYADKNPAYLIAEGAAELANVTWASNTKMQKRIQIIDKTVKELGVSLKGHIFDLIIPVDTDLPYRCKEPKEYSLVQDYQKDLIIEIFTRDKGKEQVKRTIDDGIDCIGEVTIMDLPPLAKNDCVIEVIFELTKENILSVDVEIKDLFGNVIRHGMNRIIQKGV